MRHFNRLTRLGLTAAALLVGVTAQAQKGKSTDYWPMKVGDTWTLTLKVGPQTLNQQITVTKAAPAQGGQSYTLDYVANGRTIQTETYLKTPTALLRLSAGAGGMLKATPPVPNIRYPLTSGASWTWKGTTTAGGQTFNGSSKFTVSGPETVKTPAGTFRAMHIHSALVAVQPGGSKVSIPNDYWFAPGVGLVRQTATLGTTAVDGVLTGYKLK